MRDFEVYGIGYCKAQDDWWVEYLNKEGFDIKRWKFQQSLKKLEELRFIFRNTYSLPKEAQGGKKRTMVTCWGTCRYGKWLTTDRTYKGRKHAKPDKCKLSFMEFVQEIKRLNGDELNHPLILRGSTSINRNVPSVHEYCIYTHNIEKKRMSNYKFQTENCETLFQPQSNLDIWLKKKEIHYPDSILDPLLSDPRDRKIIVETLCRRQKWLQNKEPQILDMLNYIMGGNLNIRVESPMRMAISLVLRPRKFKETETKPLTKYDDYSELLPALEFEFGRYIPENLCEKKSDMAKSLAFEIKENFGIILKDIGFEVMEKGIHESKYDELVPYNSPYIFLNLITKTWVERGISEIYEYTKLRFKRRC